MRKGEAYKAAEAAVRSLGVTCANLSIRQLISGVVLLHGDSSMRDSITKRLYPKLEEMYPSSGYAGIERNLRSARDAIVNRGDRERLEEMLGHKLRYSLSVADLLDAIVYYLERNDLWPDE